MPSIRVVVGLTLAGLAVLASSPFVLAYGGLLASKSATAGTIGDATGLANSVFNAAAFIALYYTLKLQRQEIHESRRQTIRSRMLDLESQELAAYAAKAAALATILETLREKFRVGVDDAEQASSIYNRTWNDLVDVVERLDRKMLTIMDHKTMALEELLESLKSRPL